MVMHAVVLHYRCVLLLKNPLNLWEPVKKWMGYPYFIQEYGLEVWNYADSSPISIDDVSAVREIVNDSLARSFFGTRFELATDAEQRYLAAMASLSAPPFASAAVAQAFGASGQRGVSVYREALIQKGLIWAPRRGQLDFTVPLFAEFLREYHPLSTFEQQPDTRSVE